MSAHERQPTPDAEQLRAMLYADAPTPADAEAMLDTVQRLSGWDAPTVSAAQTTQLTAQLLAALDAPPSAHAAPTRPPHLLLRIGRWLPLALLGYQRRMIGWEVWLITALIMTLGTFITAVVTRTQPSYSMDTLPLVIIAPLVAAFGVGFVYSSENNPLVELEKISTLSLPTIILARLTLIFGFNLLLGVAGSVALATVGGDLSLGMLLLAWLGPMTLLSALAFLISVLTFEPLVGGAVSLGLWVVYHLLRAWQATNVLPHLNLPALTIGAMPLAMLFMALLLCAVAFWFIEREERFDLIHKEG